jgi:nucleoside-diphosphate-sugar epimerase
LSNSPKHKTHTYLLTGATGFLGRELKDVLSVENKVITLGRKSLNDIPCDLSTTIPELRDTVEYVVHAAGKAHVIPKDEKEAQLFFQVNEMGANNLISGLERLDKLPSRFIFISTVAVYGLSKGNDIDETYPLNGRTPYARSKIHAERIIGKWCLENGIDCIILRLPLIAGKNAPGNLRALARAIKQGRYFSITGNKARKSMVAGTDVANLVASLKDRSITGVYNLTDGEDPLFVEVEQAVASRLGKSIRIKIPLVAVKFLARIGDLFHRLNIPFPLNSDKLIKMTSTLTFSCQKAKIDLGWTPHPVLPYIRSNFNKPVL